jgi:DNA-binding CsgD family transcriptional regulator
MKRTPAKNQSQRGPVDIPEVSLTRGQVNAVRAIFKAGITPTWIARQFGISQSNVRKALASDESKQ